MNAIDRASPIPFYFQIAESLRAEIAEGNWSAGHRLPSEAELCAQFDVSRSVIRQALGTLEEDGQIRKTKGRGAFVTEAPAHSWLLQSSGGLFQDEAEREGARVVSRILRAEREVLPSWATRALELAPGSVGVTLERLRWVDDQLALFVVNHLSERYVDSVLSLGDEESLYRKLQEHGVNVGGGGRTVTAVAANRKLAGLLEVDQGTPLMFIESVSWTPQGKPFDCYQAWVRGDRMRLEIRVISPKGARRTSPDREILRVVES